MLGLFLHNLESHDQHKLAKISSVLEWKVLLDTFSEASYTEQQHLLLMLSTFGKLLHDLTSLVCSDEDRKTGDITLQCQEKRETSKEGTDPTFLRGTLTHPLSRLT